ncbi:MAG: VOC family protein [Candidatus Xenobia bacterium]
MQHIRPGYTSISPHIVVHNGVKAIEFYTTVLGAQELGRHMDQDGKRVMHAELKFGDTMLMLSDEFPEMGCGDWKAPAAGMGRSVTLHLYVPDVDATFKKALAAGATEKMALEDTFWGDRYGQIVDPFGHSWSLATHQRDVSEQEIAAAASSLH